MRKLSASREICETVFEDIVLSIALLVNFYRTRKEEFFDAQYLKI